MYLNGISNPNIILPVPNNVNFRHEENTEHVWHLFVIRTAKRDELQNYLLAHGVQTLIHYPIPPNKQLAYASMNHMDYPITNSIHDEVLSLPISPVISEEEVLKVIAVLNDYE